MKTSLPNPSSLSPTLGAQASVAWRGLATWLPSQRPATKPAPGPTVRLLPSQQGSQLPWGAHLPFCIIRFPRSSSSPHCHGLPWGLGRGAIPGASRGWAGAVPHGHRHFRLCTWLWGHRALTVPSHHSWLCLGRPGQDCCSLQHSQKMLLALVQGSAVTMRWLFCGKCSPFPTQRAHWTLTSRPDLGLLCCIPWPFWSKGLLCFLSVFVLFPS